MLNMWANCDKGVESLVTFIRTPTWITAGFAQDHAGPGGANFKCKRHDAKQEDIFFLD